MNTYTGNEPTLLYAYIKTCTTLMTNGFTLMDYSFIKPTLETLSILNTNSIHQKFTASKCNMLIKFTICNQFIVQYHQMLINQPIDCNITRYCSWEVNHSADAPQS